MNIRLLIKKAGRILTRKFYLYTGLDWKFGFPNFKQYLKLKSDLKKLEAQSEKATVKFPVTVLYPCYKDRVETAGTASGAYFYQDLYVAQRIFDNKPQRHVDIGSRIDGFVAHVASFREIEIFDIRPLSEKTGLPNILFKQADLMQDVDEIHRDYTDSISCLHALEHFGLGRYGDEICYDGYKTGFENISKILKQGGTFYFSVPMGYLQRIEFHAHRVFSLKYLLEIIKSCYEIKTFVYINDNGQLINNPVLSSENIETSFHCKYGCAVFELIKK